jgi:hypothetical protein
VQWAIGCVVVYLGLFGIGAVVLGRPLRGLAAIVIAIGLTIYLVRATHTSRDAAAGAAPVETRMV